MIMPPLRCESVSREQESCHAFERWCCGAAHPVTEVLQTRCQENMWSPCLGDVRKFTCLGAWASSGVLRPIYGVGRYGAAAGGCNGANYLIDWSKGVVTR
jgi:hypothetical protein